MTDLITFLNARLDEDEAAARAALPIYGPGWRPENSKVAGLGPARIWGKDSKRPVAEAARRVSAAHIARHDPARVLREIEADRSLLAKLRQVEEFGERLRIDTEIMILRQVIAIRAAIWSDHPDYEGWLQ